VDFNNVAKALNIKYARNARTSFMKIWNKLKAGSAGSAGNPGNGVPTAEAQGKSTVKKRKAISSVAAPASKVAKTENGHNDKAMSDATNECYYDADNFKSSAATKEDEDATSLSDMSSITSDDIQGGLAFGVIPEAFHKMNQRDHKARAKKMADEALIAVNGSAAPRYPNQEQREDEKYVKDFPGATVPIVEEEGYYRAYNRDENEA
jgi:hypothetical protein